MKQIMRVFANTGRIDHPINRIQGRDRFLKALLANFENRSVLGDGFVEIEAASRADLQNVSETAKRCGVAFTYAVDLSLSASEMKRAKFVRLGIEGEPVDEDEDGQALNLHPTLLCETCVMPAEPALPEPYLVAETRVLDCSARWGEGPLSANREVFSGSMGVFFVASRVREILDCVIREQVVFSPVVFENSGSASGEGLWAVRPVVNWGSRLGRIERARCSQCSKPTEARLDTGEFSAFDDARYTVASESLPNLEIAAANGWFGNRREAPFAFWRDVYVSGRLYTLLRQFNVRGLSRPSDVVWVGDELPMRSSKEVSSWLRDANNRCSR